MIRVGSSGCLYLFLTCLFPCLSMCLLRGRARSRLGISDGNCAEDCCAAFLCTPCVNCQVSLDEREGIFREFKSILSETLAKVSKYSHPLRWPTRLTAAFKEREERRPKLKMSHR